MKMSYGLTSGAAGTGGPSSLHPSNPARSPASSSDTTSFSDSSGRPVPIQRVAASRIAGIISSTGRPLSPVASNGLAILLRPHTIEVRFAEAVPELGCVEGLELLFEAAHLGAPLRRQRLRTQNKNALEPMPRFQLMKNQ